MFLDAVGFIDSDPSYLLNYLAVYDFMREYGAEQSHRRGVHDCFLKIDSSPACTGIKRYFTANNKPI